MAEIQNSPKSDGRPKRRSSRVDMTAMVDVAFLLLTFFILTTSLTDNKAMVLNKPALGPSGPVPCEKMMTLYPDGDDRILVVKGCEGAVSVTDYSAEGLREVITTFLAATPEGVISVKPTTSAMYGNVVDVLDEFHILGVPRHALATLTDEDRNILLSNGY
jgi:biopolymer transport protein ExbD